MSLKSQGLLQSAMIVLSAKKKYDESTKVKTTVESLIRKLSVARDAVKKFVVDSGVKIRDGARTAKAKVKEYSPKIASAYEDAKQKARNLMGSKQDIVADNVAATEQEKLRNGFPTSLDPPGPNASIGKDGTVSKPTEEDLVKDKDGNNELDYLKEIAASLENGLNNKDEGHVGIAERWQERDKERDDQRTSAWSRLGKGGAKGGKGLSSWIAGGTSGILGLLFGGAFKLISGSLGMLFAPFTGLIRTMSGGIAGAVQSALWEATKWGVKLSGKILFKGINVLTLGLAGRIGRVFTSTFGTLGGFMTALKTQIGTGFSMMTSFLGSKWTAMTGFLGAQFTALMTTIKTSSMGQGIGRWGRKLFGRGSLIGRGIGMLGSAGAWVGGIAAKAGGLIVAAGPIGWVVAGVAALGLALWGGYKLYKYFKEGQYKFPDTVAGDLSYLRMAAYGLTEEDAEFFPKIFELEEVCGPFIKYDENENVVKIEEADENAKANIAKIFGMSEQKGDYEEAVHLWLARRFMPSYAEFLRCLWNIDRSKKVPQLDELNERELADLVYNFSPPSKIWDIVHLPFKDKVKSDITRERYDEMHINLKNKTRAEWYGRQREMKDKRTVNKTIDRETNKEGKGGEVPNSKERKDAISKALLNGANGGKGFSIGDINNISTAGNASNPNMVYDPKQMKFVERDGITSVEDTNGQTYRGDGTGIDEAIRMAAEATGVDEDTLWTMAKIESSLDPYANANGGDKVAKGLFQFTKSTWDWFGPQVAKKYGLDFNKMSPLNPKDSALMGAEYFLWNEKNYDLSGLGMPRGMEGYLRHFMGGRGASDFVKGMKKNPNALITSVFKETSAAYKNNMDIMADKKTKKPRTFQEVFEEIFRRYKSKQQLDPTKFEAYRTYQRDNANAKVGGVSSGSISGDIDASYGQAMQDKHDTIIKQQDEIAASMPSPDEKGISQFEARHRKNNIAKAQQEVADNFDPTYNLKAYGKARVDAGGNFMDRLSNTVSDYYKAGMDKVNGKTTNEVKESTVDGQYQGGSGGQGGSSITTFPIAPGYPFVYTSLFGPRNVKECPGASKDHGGIDIGVPGNKQGTPIVSVGAGKVWRAYSSTTYGHVVYLLHKDGTQTRYAHLVAGSIKVREGQEIDAGTLVGLMGSTGTGTGTHLHFELRNGHGQDSPKLDPMSNPLIASGWEGKNIMMIVDKATGKVMRYDGKERVGGGTIDLGNLDEFVSQGGAPQPNQVTGDVPPPRGRGGFNGGGSLSTTDKPLDYEDGIYNDSGYGDDSQPETAEKEKLNVDVKVDTGTLEGNTAKTNDKLDDVVNAIIELKNVMISPEEIKAHRRPGDNPIGDREGERAANKAAELRAKQARGNVASNKSTQTSGTYSVAR